jgi:hypothetical protein
MSEASQTSEKAIKTQADEAAESRAAAKAEAAAKAAGHAKAKADIEAGKGIKVKMLVNMMAKDGTNLIKGKEQLLSASEVARLEAEPRFEKKPHFIRLDAAPKAAAAK